MTLAPLPAAVAPRAAPRRKRIALAALALFGVAAVVGVRHVTTLRAHAAPARAAAHALEGELARAADAWIVDVLDGAPATSFAAAAHAAAARVDAGEFAAAPSEELALSIRVGAALREVGELDAAAARLAADARRARSASGTANRAWDRIAGRAVAEPELAALADVELAATALARDDDAGALRLARSAWEILRPTAKTEKRSTAIAACALVLARAHAELGDSARAAEYARIAVDESPARDPAHAHVRWSALRFLALDAQHAGRRKDAIEEHRTAIASARWSFPDDDPRTATSRYDLAYLLHDEGPLHADEARREYAASLAVLLARSRGDREDLATHQGNYALLLKRMGRLAEAEPVAASALAMLQRLVPGDATRTATMMNNVGTLRHALGDRAGAETILRDALAMRRRLFPDGHADVAQTLQNLAWLKQNQLEYAEAVRFGREAVALLERIGHPEDLAFAIALDNLGGALTDAKEYAEAEVLTRRALAIEDRLIEGDHDTRAQTLDNLGVILYRLERFDEAETHLTAALAMRRALYGMDHPDVAMTRSHLAWVAEETGRHAQAVEHYRAAISALDGAASDPNLRAEIGVELGNCQRAAGETDAAFATYRATLAAATKDPALCSWPMADAARGLSRCARTLVRFTEVELELERAAELALTTRGYFLAARARTVEALCELLDAWPRASRDRARAVESASRWRARLDAADEADAPRSR